MFLQFAIAFSLIQIVIGSNGDSSQFFERCTYNCQVQNCTKDGIDFVGSIEQPSVLLKLLLWDCESECKYECVWKTTDAYIKRGWKVPQFYGKWPFVRILGIQEPASFIFSLMNLYGHIRGFSLIRKNVRSDSPFYWIWQCASVVTLHAWLWSSIFHARDLPFTEVMDYTSAFSIIVVQLYAMVQRFFYGMPRFLNIMISVFFLAFFANHAIYLSAARVDYGYNMKLNVQLGSATILGWFVWSFWNRNKQPYLWKSAAFFTLTAFISTLEIFDFPPILWVFDSHSLWHLGTAIICPLLYSFIIDDCKNLREQMYLKQKNV